MPTFCVGVWVDMGDVVVVTWICKCSGHVMVM